MKIHCSIVSKHLAYIVHSKYRPTGTETGHLHQERARPWLASDRLEMSGSQFTTRASVTLFRMG